MTVSLFLRLLLLLSALPGSYCAHLVGTHNYNHWLASRIEVTWSVHGRHSREVLDKERGMFFCLFSLMIYAMVDI